MCNARLAKMYLNSFEWTEESLANKNNNILFYLFVDININEEKKE